MPWKRILKCTGVIFEWQDFRNSSFENLIYESIYESLPIFVGLILFHYIIVKEKINGFNF